MIHLYCLAVQAGFYSDVVECSPVTQAARVRFPVAALVIRIFSPVTSVCFRGEENEPVIINIFENKESIKLISLVKKKK